MVNKFAKNLSASNADIKTTRAQSLADETVLEVETFVQTLKKEKLQLQNKLNNLTDLAPDNTYSLRPGSKDFNASKWVKELHSTKMDLKLKIIELEEAEAIYKEWFAPTEE
jgi:hypothetical protein